MADCYVRTDDQARARESLEVALAIFELLGSPRAARLTAQALPIVQTRVAVIGSARLRHGA